MGQGFYGELRALLLSAGCTFVRQGAGSHEIWQSPISQKRFSVPVTVASRFTANAILKQAGIVHKM
ncbi:type II toxin-antitoxin system HicA family toxin [Candidatus Accumulibacter vicinus]|uniref:YcfA-like protein n=1 Tax=Candidatus Accumulibacter vicinus TaxID=2954382 RepID=A0A084Y2A0_9PROT|nr:type II toxin-antitoxin system HicA family toxin [Candidatus Accumulibacter vicinus]KFB68844.1 MAG: YcfA-like protein [Candidatus Accumulibacter vicinus]